MKTMKVVAVSVALISMLGATAAEKKFATGESVSFTAADAEIVIAVKASPVLRFAAKEAKTFLSQVLGVDVPIVNEPSQGKASLVLGANGWADAAGFTTNSLVRDAYTIAAKGSCVYVLGRDSATVDPEWVLKHGGWSSVLFERATMFGVYDFLERFAKVRFYFPGELGTIVPKAAAVVVRDGVTVSPDFTSPSCRRGTANTWRTTKEASRRRSTISVCDMKRSASRAATAPTA